MTATPRLLAAGLFLLAAVGPAPMEAQSTAVDFRDEFLAHFQSSARRMAQLSAAMPEGTYAWSPGEGVMSVARVYMHIARYNYLYLDGSLGIPAPEGVDWENFESIADRATVLDLLQRSFEHVTEHVTAMTENDLTRMTMLYGRSVPGWAVLFQLLSHMNEHVGQSIAYARMNGVVPPWSR